MLPYQGRHSGASVERAENSRTLESVQKRTKRADVSTRPGQSSLHWSTRTASTATPALGIASCSRLRHRLNCFASSAGSSKPKHRLATFFLEPRCTVCETRSFYDDHTVFFDENSRSFCASWQVAEPLPERSRHQYPRSHFLETVASAECDATLGTARFVSF